MEPHSDPSVPQQEQGDDTPARLHVALDQLVDRGVLSRIQADAVVRQYREQPRPAGLRHLLGEIAGYLGASLVAGAALLFLSEGWNILGHFGRFAVLAVMATVMIGAGLAVRWQAAAPGHGRRDPWSGDGTRRRLVSTLITGAAGAAGFAGYVAVQSNSPEVAARNWAPLVASVAGLTVVVAGYLLARSALGQFGIVVAVVAVYSSLLDLVVPDQSVLLGIGLVALGAVWAALAWRRLVIAEYRFALAVAVTLGLTGAQLVVAGDAETANFTGYALTLLVAGACFAAYVRLRDWVVLAGGVVGATVVVPEFLNDVTDGSLGASGVMLVAGVILLAGSLIGLRIRPRADRLRSAS